MYIVFLFVPIEQFIVCLYKYIYLLQFSVIYSYVPISFYTYMLILWTLTGVKTTWMSVYTQIRGFCLLQGRFDHLVCESWWTKWYTAMELGRFFCQMNVVSIFGLALTWF